MGFIYNVKSDISFNYVQMYPICMIHVIITKTTPQ